MDLLEIRLNELDSVVDKFVIVEAEKTHQNKEKPLYFNNEKDSERFKKFKDKIIHLIVPANEFNEDTWKNENHQFRCIMKGLQEADTNDLILISCLDEIPKASVIKELKKNPIDIPHYLKHDFFFFYLDTIYESVVEGTTWTGTCVARKHHLEAEDMYSVFIRRQQFKNLIHNAGWHFSFMGDVDNALTKINSYAHIEFTGITKKNMTLFMENLKDPLGRNETSFHHHEDLNNLPIYIQENLSKYKKHIHQRI